MKYLIYILIACLPLACSESSEVEPSCEVVINDQGPGFLKVINKRSSKISVFLSEYAFSATMRSNACEIFGLNTGLRKAEISICADSDCDTYLDTKKITFLIEDDKTYTIEVTEDYFNN